MSVESTRISICQQLGVGGPKGQGQGKQSKGGNKSLLAEIEAQLRSLKGNISPPNVLQAAVDDARAEAEKYWPGDAIEDMEELKRLLEACAWLTGVPPVAALIGNVLGLFDQVSDAIDSIALTVPEMGIGNLISSLLDALALLRGGKGTSKSIEDTDLLIECLNSLCNPSQVPSLTDPMKFILEADDLILENNTLIDDMGLVSSGPLVGQFDMDGMYDRVGLDVDEKDAMNVVNDGIAAIKEDTNSAVESAVESAKSLSTGGGLFDI